jgi:demethylmenaquinone methyltransferase/2-methoxy-6-polyprenyl-1,4-benzoquinol methylase
VTRAELDKDPRDVAAMFDAVAPRYDLTNTVLALGRDRSWRRATVAAVAATAGETVLDLAAGTGTSTVPLGAQGADVVGCDLSLGMLRAGHARRPGLRLVAGDALALPFADASFDAVTISFGLRNTTDVGAALAEIARVTRPGGRLVICEFSAPTWGPFRRLYLGYLLSALPALSRLASSDPAAYDYLAESIRAWPDREHLAGMLRAAGYTAVAWRDLTGGIVALHRATRAARSTMVTS